MATAKIVTWSRKDKNGNYPIGIKVSQNGNPAYLFEGNALSSRDLWDASKQQVKKSHPQHMRLTNLLLKSFLKLTRKYSNLKQAESDIRQKILSMLSSQNQ